MGTIAEKLEYLDGTREKILTETNRLGVGLTEQDKFRDYAKGLHDGYVDVLNNGIDTLYDNMEKVSGSGSAITLENIEEAPMRSDLEGDTYQFSTTGKNLFNNAMQPTNEGDSRVAVSTIDTGKRLDYTGSGSSGSYIWRCFAIMDLTNYVGRSIRFKCNFNASGNNKAQYNIGLCNVDGTNRVTKAASTTSGQTSSFVVPELSGEQTYLLLTLYVNANGSIQTDDYVEYTNMILTIDNIDMTYEPYTGGTASPNPDYPQPINVVSGRQTITTCGKNLFDGNYENLSTGVRYKPIYVGDGTFTMSSNIPQSSSGNSLFFLTGNVSSGASSSTNGVDVSTARTITSTNGYVTIGYRGGGNFIDPREYKTMLEKGSTASQYEEYKGQNYEINLGKNLADLINGTYTTQNEITGVIENGKITLNGTATATRTLQNFNNTMYLEKGTYTLSANNTTTISGGNNNSIRISDMDGSTVSGTTCGFGTLNNSITFTISTAAIYKFQVRTASGTTYDNFVIYPQLEKGSQATSYSPYKTPIELCKINDYKDRIYKDNNKWYIEKNIGKVVLNGSESWETQSIKTNTTAYSLLSNIGYKATGSDSINAFVNYFKGNTNGYNIDEECFWFNGSGYLRLRISNTIASTVAQFKTWLSTHNTTIYYVLATPTTTEITDNELLTQLNNWYNQKSIEGETNISVTSEDLPAILNVKALKQYE